MNTHTGVYFGSTPQTLPCCWKYSLEHQVCLKPQLNLVAHKSTFSSKKLQRPAVLKHDRACFKGGGYLKIGLGAECHKKGKTNRNSHIVLLHCRFWSFSAVVDSKYNGA